MFLYIANWKMQMSSSESLSFCEQNYTKFLGLSRLPNKKVVLCPSFEQIKVTSDIFDDTSIEIGAQNCSAFKQGPYTGQIMAKSLKEVGCSYCIVGHNESRVYCSEKSNEVAEKVFRLLELGIKPILCVGESKEEYDLGLSKKAIKDQLFPVFSKLKIFPRSKIYIAYEPIWAIGTGVVPEKVYIGKVFKYITELFKISTFGVEVILLYGGSINEENVKHIRSIARIGGLLIGGASLDFKKFEKIVTL